jgi:RNA polymerase sigma-70 factor (ECF subfamily)
LTPEELALRAQRGSLAHFGELVTRFEGRLFNFLLRRTRNAEDAADLTQETFVRAWERIERYDSAWRFSTWLFTIGARLAASHHRARRRHPTVSGVEHHAASTQEPGSQGAHELGARLWRLAERVLSDDARMALWLRYAEDLSIGEIAVVMGKTEVGVRVCLFRARQALAQASGLAAQGHASEGHGQGHGRHDLHAEAAGDAAIGGAP